MTRVFILQDDRNELDRLQGTLCNYQSFSEKASNENMKSDDLVVSESSQDISVKEFEVDEAKEVSSSFTILCGSVK